VTTEATHHTSGSLPLAVALAATAGFVDAFIYVRVTPVFVANMSGNLVRLGIAAGGHNGRAVAAAGVALLGFVFGAVVATVALDARLRRGGSPSPGPLLLLESALLIVLPVIMWAGEITFSPSIEPIDYIVIVVAATAMGVQAVALRRVGQIAVSTTYGTGAVVRLGEKLALALRRAHRPDDVRRRVTIAVLGSVLVGYVVGAGIGASIGSSHALMLLPAAVPLIAVGVSRARRRGN
jgi:uncharacterized membrane protein YoaK (UPF0700 family)